MSGFRHAAIIAAAFASSASWAGTTASTGSGQAFSNYQPSLVMTQLLATAGNFPAQGPQQGATLGMVRSFAGDYEAFGAPRALGQTLGINSNQALFAVLGTTYGGNGVTTFALPDLGGRSVVGAGSGFSGYAVGTQVGTASTVLTTANLPAHAHSLAGGVSTGSIGGGSGFDNHQPSLALTYLIATGGVFPSQTDTITPFLGQIAQFAGDYAPGGWMQAAGQTLLIRDNQALFSVLGTTFGGDGRTTFQLPNLVGRTIVGAGTRPGLAPVLLGEQVGTDTTVLTLSQMAPHAHGLANGNVTGGAGAGQPIDNRQPSLGLNYIISLGSIFPFREGVGSFPDSGPFFGEVEAFAGDFAPGGWAFADGRLLSISEFSILFSLIGTTYGGDGRSTFALPDLRGRTIVGRANQFELGTQLGVQDYSLTIANLPAHMHGVSDVAVVPEPATWALMIGGFAMTGVTMRRRKPVFAE